MERDRKKNAGLIACANACGMKWDERVSYQITTKIDSQAKKGIMIIDEVDAPVFNDVVGFYENTKYVNLKIIGLTATAFHGKEDGVEAGTLAALDY
jgi:hypothetical protein